jgi:hypothetical protein
MLGLANILVDVVHELPPGIEALLPKSLRHLLSRLPMFPLTNTHPHTGDLAEYNSNRARVAGSANGVHELTALYRDRQSPHLRERQSR